MKNQIKVLLSSFLLLLASSPSYAMEAGAAKAAQEELQRQKAVVELRNAKLETAKKVVELSTNTKVLLIIAAPVIIAGGLVSTALGKNPFTALWGWRAKMMGTYNQAEKIAEAGLKASLSAQDRQILANAAKLEVLLSEASKLLGNAEVMKNLTPEQHDMLRVAAQIKAQLAADPEVKKIEANAAALTKYYTRCFDAVFNSGQEKVTAKNALGTCADITMGELLDLEARAKENDASRDATARQYERCFNEHLESLVDPLAIDEALKKHPKLKDIENLPQKEQWRKKVDVACREGGQDYLKKVRAQALYLKQSQANVAARDAYFDERSSRTLWQSVKAYWYGYDPKDVSVLGTVNTAAGAAKSLHEAQIPGLQAAWPRV